MKKMKIKPVNGVTAVEAMIGMTLLLIILLAGFKGLRTIAVQRVADLNQTKVNEAINAARTQFWSWAGFYDDYNGDTITEPTFDIEDFKGWYFFEYQPDMATNRFLPVPSDPIGKFTDDVDKDYDELDEISGVPAAYWNSKIRVAAKVGPIEFPENWRQVTIYAEWNEGGHIRTRKETYYASRTRLSNQGHKLKIKIVDASKLLESTPQVVGVQGITIKTKGLNDVDIFGRTDEQGIAVIHGLKSSPDPIPFEIIGHQRGDPENKAFYYFRNPSNVWDLADPWIANPGGKDLGSTVKKFEMNFNPTGVLMATKDLTDTSVSNNFIGQPSGYPGYFPMFPYGAISGTVFDISGPTPIPGIGIAIIPIITEVGSPNVNELSVITNSNGTYDQTVPPGYYQVVALGSAKNREGWNINSDLPQLRQKPSRLGNPADLWSDFKVLGAPETFYSSVGRTNQASTSDISFSDYPTKFIRVLPGKTYSKETTGNRNALLDTVFYTHQMGNLRVRFREAEWVAADNKYRFKPGGDTLPGGERVFVSDDPRRVYFPDPTPNPTQLVFQDPAPEGIHLDTSVLIAKDYLLANSSPKDFVKAYTDMSGWAEFLNLYLPVIDADYRESVSPDDDDQFNLKSKADVFPGPWKNGDFIPIMVLSGGTDPDDQRYVMYLGPNGAYKLGYEKYYVVVPSAVFEPYNVKEELAVQKTGYDNWSGDSFGILINPFLGNRGTKVAQVMALKKSHLAYVHGYLVQEPASAGCIKDSVSSSDFDSGVCVALQPVPTPVSLSDQKVDVYTWALNKNNSSDHHIDLQYKVVSEVSEVSPGKVVNEYKFGTATDRIVVPTLPGIASTANGNERYIRIRKKTTEPPGNTGFFGTASLLRQVCTANCSGGATKPSVKQVYKDMTSSLPTQYFVSTSWSNTTGTGYFSNEPWKTSSFSPVAGDHYYFQMNNNPNLQFPVSKNYRADRPVPVYPGEDKQVDIFLNTPEDYNENVFVRMVPNNKMVQMSAPNSNFRGVLARFCPDTSVPGGCNTFTSISPGTNFYGMVQPLDLAERYVTKEISGTVTIVGDPPIPVAGAHVWIWVSSHENRKVNGSYNKLVGKVITDSDGNFHIDGALAGSSGSSWEGPVPSNPPLLFDVIPGRPIENIILKAYIPPGHELKATHNDSGYVDTPSYAGHEWTDVSITLPEKDSVGVTGEVTPGGM